MVTMYREANICLCIFFLSFGYFLWLECGNSCIYKIIKIYSLKMSCGRRWYETFFDMNTDCCINQSGKFYKDLGDNHTHLPPSRDYGATDRSLSSRITTITACIISYQPSHTFRCLTCLFFISDKEMQHWVYIFHYHFHYIYFICVLCVRIDIYLVFEFQFICVWFWPMRWCYFLLYKWLFSFISFWRSDYPVSNLNYTCPQ